MIHVFDFYVVVIILRSLRWGTRFLPITVLRRHTVKEIG